MEPTKVVLGKAEIDVVVPGLSECEEIGFAVVDARKHGNRASRRVLAAAIGLCVPLVGKRVGVTYEACGCSPLAFGGKVYDHLLRNEVTAEQVDVAGNLCLGLMLDARFPRDEEVKNRQGFSVGGESGSAPPSA